MGYVGCLTLQSHSVSVIHAYPQFDSVCQRDLFMAMLWLMKKLMYPTSKRYKKAAMTKDINNERQATEGHTYLDGVNGRS